MMILHLFTFCAAVSVLPHLFISVKRVVAERNAVAMMLAVVSVMIAATYVSAMFHVDDFLSVVPMYLKVFQVLGIIIE